MITLDFIDQYDPVEALVVRCLNCKWTVRFSLVIAGTIERVASLDNLWLAWRKAAKGKRRREDVAAFGMRAESHLIELARELLGGSWQAGGYRTFLIHEPEAA